MNLHHTMTHQPAQTSSGKSGKSFGAQRGVALVFVLLMLAIAMGIAIAIAHMTLSGSKASRNDRDRQIAFQSAEQALNDAELDLMDINLTDKAVKDQSLGTKGRACKIGHPFPQKNPPPEGIITVAPGCHNTTEGDQHGICNLDDTPPKTPLYKMINWTVEETSDDRQYVIFGEYTGRTSQLTNSTATGIAPALKPRYVIIQTAVPAPVKTGANKVAAFKIYAIGYGANKNTQVMLESEIYKPGFEKACYE